MTRTKNNNSNVVISLGSIILIVALAIISVVGAKPALGYTSFWREGDDDTYGCIRGWVSDGICMGDYWIPGNGGNNATVAFMAGWTGQQAQGRTDGSPQEMEAQISFLELEYYSQRWPGWANDDNEAAAMLALLIEMRKNPGVLVGSYEEGANSPSFNGLIAGSKMRSLKNLWDYATIATDGAAHIDGTYFYNGERGQEAGSGEKGAFDNREDAGVIGFPDNLADRGGIVSGISANGQGFVKNQSLTPHFMGDGSHFIIPTVLSYEQVFGRIPDGCSLQGGYEEAPLFSVKVIVCPSSILNAEQRVRFGANVDTKEGCSEVPSCFGMETWQYIDGPQPYYRPWFENDNIPYWIFIKPVTPAKGGFNLSLTTRIDGGQRYNSQIVDSVDWQSNAPLVCADSDPISEPGHCRSYHNPTLTGQLYKMNSPTDTDYNNSKLVATKNVSLISSKADADAQTGVTKINYGNFGEGFYTSVVKTTYLGKTFTDDPAKRIDETASTYNRELHIDSRAQVEGSDTDGTIIERLRMWGRGTNLPLGDFTGVPNSPFVANNYTIQGYLAGPLKSKPQYNAPGTQPKLDCFDPANCVVKQKDFEVKDTDYFWQFDRSDIDPEIVPIDEESWYVFYYHYAGDTFSPEFWSDAGDAFETLNFPGVENIWSAKLKTQATKIVEVGDSISDVADIVLESNIDKIPEGITLEFDVYKDDGSLQPSSSNLAGHFGPYAIDKSGSYSTEDLSELGVGKYYWVATIYDEDKNIVAQDSYGDKDETTMIVDISSDVGSRYIDVSETNFDVYHLDGAILDGMTLTPILKHILSDDVSEDEIVKIYRDISLSRSQTDFTTDDFRVDEIGSYYYTYEMRYGDELISVGEDRDPRESFDVVGATKSKAYPKVYVGQPFKDSVVFTPSEYMVVPDDVCVIWQLYKQNTELSDSDVRDDELMYTDRHHQDYTFGTDVNPTGCVDFGENDKTSILDEDGKLQESYYTVESPFYTTTDVGQYYWVESVVSKSLLLNGCTLNISTKTCPVLGRGAPRLENETTSVIPLGEVSVFSQATSKVRVGEDFSDVVWVKGRIPVNAQVSWDIYRTNLESDLTEKDELVYTTDRIDISDGVNSVGPDGKQNVVIEKPGELIADGTAYIGREVKVNAQTLNFDKVGQYYWVEHLWAPQVQEAVVVSQEKRAESEITVVEAAAKSVKVGLASQNLAKELGNTGLMTSTLIGTAGIAMVLALVAKTLTNAAARKRGGKHAR
ncbi:hypothetical protein FACS1894125_2120 [Actinomycetota bacterium]|nr:hypothetical protein FACS1894125_2120 [Actinomycetota bacterium]